MQKSIWIIEWHAFSFVVYIGSIFILLRKSIFIGYKLLLFFIDNLPCHAPIKQNAMISIWKTSSFVLKGYHRKYFDTFNCSCECPYKVTTEIEISKFSLKKTSLATFYLFIRPCVISRETLNVNVAPLCLATFPS